MCFVKLVILDDVCKMLLNYIHDIFYLTDTIQDSDTLTFKITLFSEF